MTNEYKEYISPYWAGFRITWWIVAIILFILLLLMWIKGYGPGGKHCVAPIVETPAEKVVATVVPESIPEAAPVVESAIEPVMLDNTGPSISMSDSSPIHLTVGDSFIDPGATATDDTDGEATITTTGVVDTSTPGEYILTYTATDKAGNTTSDTRTIIVAAAPDTEGPVITLDGSSTVRLTAGDNYTDPGATATDNVDGDVTVTTAGNVVTSTPGEYTLTYTATDMAGTTTTETRTIIVSQPVQTPVETQVQDMNLPEARLYFDYNEDSNPSDSDNSLADVVSYLKANSGATAIVSGFHDPTGNFDHNQGLAKRRAETIIGLLINAGVSTNQIVMDKPAETTGSGSLEEARRVEVKIEP